VSIAQLVGICIVICMGGVQTLDTPLIHLEMHPNIFRDKSAEIGALGKNFKKVSRGVLWFKTRDDIRFIKCAAVKTASSHKYFGTLVEKSKVLVG